MKFSFVSFLLALATAQADNETQNLRKLSDRSESGPPEDAKPIHFNGEGCVNFDPTDTDWTKFNPLNDQSALVPDIGFDFNWYGVMMREIFINDNGNISFENGIGGQIPRDFSEPGRAQEGTRSHDMIAGFWADVNAAVGDGEIYFKMLTDSAGSKKFAALWREVKVFPSSFQSKTNTFEIVLSDGLDGTPTICFCYCQMEWANDPEDSDRAAIIGVNPINVIADEPGVNFLLGGFDEDVGGFNGFGTTENNGASWLTGKSFCFTPDIANEATDGLMSLVAVNGAGPVAEAAGACGDPHFKTWQGEHFEYHGQCDLVLTKDAKFAEGLGLDVHIRTKLVRFWSYIKNAVIRIGDDILEIEGSVVEGVDPEVHYWINYEYQGELTEFAGFPVTISSEGTKSNKNKIEIDLSSKYPGQKIVLSTFKEFVKVDFQNASVESFGNSVGMLGDFKTGKTVARDGASVMDSYAEYGHEWQVLPSDGKFFREASEPQFPKKCIDPEDPQGERRRRLAESTISVEQAESACSGLKDALDRKDCVYDILATQDMDMVGAF